MSCVVVIAPMIMVGVPIAPLAAAAAAALGFRRALANAEAEAEAEAQARADAGARAGVTVAVSSEAAAALAAGVRADSAASFTNGRVTITVSRDPRGQVSVHAEGQGTKAELTAAAEAFAGRLVQQYAYQKVATELKQLGYAVATEEVAADATVRVRFRKPT